MKAMFVLLATCLLFSCKKEEYTTYRVVLQTEIRHSSNCRYTMRPESGVGPDRFLEAPCGYYRPQQGGIIIDIKK